MSDPLFYIESYFCSLKRIQKNYPNLSSDHQADLAFADTCEVIGIYGTFQDLQQITQIHTDYKLMQFERERGIHGKASTASKVS